jgi:hypothetical protein
MAINELLRALLGCLVVLAIHLDTAFNATIVANDVGIVRNRGRPPAGNQFG